MEFLDKKIADLRQLQLSRRQTRRRMMAALFQITGIQQAVDTQFEYNALGVRSVFNAITLTQDPIVGKVFIDPATFKVYEGENPNPGIVLQLRDEFSIVINSNSNQYTLQLDIEVRSANHLLRVISLYFTVHGSRQDFDSKERELVQFQRDLEKFAEESRPKNGHTSNDSTSSISAPSTPSPQVSDNEAGRGSRNEEEVIPSTKEVMDMDPITIIAYSVVGLISLGLIWVINVLFRNPISDALTAEPQEKKKSDLGGDGDRGQQSGKKNNKGNKANTDKVGKGKNKPRSRTTSEAESIGDNHPWSAAIFRGHAGLITDMNWSSNDKFIASCAQDRTILIWFAKDLLTKDRRSIRVNVPFDNARLISWSPDCTAFIVSREEEKVLEVYKMGKKAEGSHVTVSPLIKFNKEHEEDIVGIGIACTGLYIMSCSKDGNVYLWDVKGTLIDRTTVPVGTTATYAKVSNCARYIAVCGSDCIILEVIFNEMKEFKSVRIFGKLKGHESRVQHDFNADSTKIVTVTENGFWRLFYTTGNRINIVCMGQAKSVPVNGHRFFPTVSPSSDGRVVAVGHTNQVDIFEVTLGSPMSSIKPSWTIPSDGVMKIIFSSDGKYILTAGENPFEFFTMFVDTLPHCEICPSNCLNLRQTLHSKPSPTMSPTYVRIWQSSN